MRIINKKYLLIILLVGVILTGVTVFRPKENIKLDNEISKQKVNNRTFAMYTETDNGYKEYDETKFPEGYVLNINESKCIDNNGKEVDNILSYNNGEVTVTSGKTTYCYLYFDKSLGLEIKEKTPNGLKIDKVRGAMYRFQGQQADDIRNYICFGTSDKDKCTSDTDHYMYRIIGIEAETGRVKVIKKEALEDTYQWYTDSDIDIEFPQSKIYEAISGAGFLDNDNYVPVDAEKNINWEEKISNNTWMYGDMFTNDVLGSRQIGEELYLAETGQKGTIWDSKANEGDEGAIAVVVGNDYSKYYGQTVYFIRQNNKKWIKKFESKVSLMYLHDYHYSVSDDANCQYDENNYAICKTGWMHLSQNDTSAPNINEWTMTRYGWEPWSGVFIGHYVESSGYSYDIRIHNYLSMRPVFYINASEKLLDGEGTIDNPFIIKS